MKNKDGRTIKQIEVRCSYDNLPPIDGMIDGHTVRFRFDPDAIGNARALVDSINEGNEISLCDAVLVKVREKSGFLKPRAVATLPLLKHRACV